MTVLTAMTLPSPSPTSPSSSPREGQTQHQADAPPANDFETKLNQATRPAEPKHQEVSAPKEASTNSADASPDTVEAEHPLVSTDNWAAQLAYLQPPPPGSSISTPPEMDVLNHLGKALTPPAEPSAEELDTTLSAIDTRAPSLDKPIVQLRAAATTLNAAATLETATAPTLTIESQPETRFSVIETLDGARPAEPSTPTPTTVSISPSTNRSPELLPQVPGTATPLQAQALQHRMDEALRWMAGQGVQAAQIRIAPEALGPVTIHLHMSGDQASVAFISTVDTTRQALEANLDALKEALSQQGFSLDQTFVGNEEQHAAQQSQQEALAQQTAQDTGINSLSTSNLDTASTTAPSTMTRQGLVDVFA